MLKTSIVIPIVTALCGFLSAIVVFSYLGNMSKETGVPLDKIPMVGTSLAFIVFPSVVARLPLSNFWAVIFFLTLFCNN